MLDWTVVSRTEHAHSYWKSRQGFGFVATSSLIPVMLAELAKLIPHYVLCFAKNEHEEFKASALVGYGEGQNVYVNKSDKWLCTYVPAYLRAFPFTVQYDQAGDSILSIEKNYLTTDKECVPLFTGEELSPQTTQILSFLNDREKSLRATDAAVKQIVRCDLLEPWSVTVQRPNEGGELTITGLFKINEETLNQLDAPCLQSLRDSGALILIYAQLFSIAQMNQLTDRALYKSNEKSPKDEHNEFAELFSDERDDSLNFDNI